MSYGNEDFAWEKEKKEIKKGGDYKLEKMPRALGKKGEKDNSTAVAWPPAEAEQRCLSKKEGGTDYQGECRGCVRNKDTLFVKKATFVLLAEKKDVYLHEIGYVNSATGFT